MYAMLAVSIDQCRDPFDLQRMRCSFVLGLASLVRVLAEDVWSETGSRELRRTGERRSVVLCRDMVIVEGELLRLNGCWM